MSGKMSASLVWDGGEVVIPEEMGVPSEDQMLGTMAERLSELCGRVCYDSLGRGRTSPEYHDHLLNVGHWSVYEHYNRTVLLDVDNPLEWLPVFLNRRGVWVRLMPLGAIRFTLNLRSVLEWDRWNDAEQDKALLLGNDLRRLFNSEAPMVVKDDHPGSDRLPFSPLRFVDPLDDHEKWVSLFMSGSRGFCYDSETEVLTDEGWIPWPEISGSESFATLNPESEELEYQKASDVIHEPYHGRMVRVSSQCVDLLVTPNHRMLVRKFDTQAARRNEEPLSILPADQIGRRRVRFKRNAKWVGEEPNHFTIPDLTIEAPISNQTGTCGTRTVVCKGRRVNALPFARLIGWWLAEGSLDHSRGGGYYTIISQSEGSRHWDDILGCIKESGFTYSINKSATCPQVRINGGRALYDYLKPYAGASNKRIPTELKLWGSNYQKELIEGYLAGDGSNGGGRHAGEGHTVSRGLADDLQEAALKAGMSANIREVDRRGEDTPIRHRKVIYVVGFAKHRGREPLINHNGKRHVSERHYSGMVHCVTVPNGTLYVRRNGKPCWSGNSHEQVRHGDETAISQRSTRYVDESESPWVIHPLIQKFISESGAMSLPLKAQIDGTIEHSRSMYSDLVDKLQNWLVERMPGDTPYRKTTARKQARGAARGLLGNALQTEMIFSASVAQWKHMARMRAADAADAEIRTVYNKVVPILKASKYGDRFSHIAMEPASDGLGMSLVGGGAK